MEVLSRYIIMEMAFMSFFSGRRQTDPDPAPRPVEKPLPAPILPPALPTPGFESILGAHSVMEGKLESHANIRLDGIFTGSLDITGNVLIGETATITADVNAKNISIAGAVRGNVNGNKVQLLRTARVVGDIRATSLTMEEGAYLDGKISMIHAEPEAEPVEEPAQPAPDVDDDSDPVAADDHGSVF